VSKISAAHVSAALGRWHTRASEPSGRVSGFVVSIDPVRQLGSTVTVRYQDYDHGYSNAETEAVSRIATKAFGEYAATLARAGYVTEKWMKYDGSQLGLFVTGKK
jgi:hypothetical protein